MTVSAGVAGSTVASLAGPEDALFKDFSFSSFFTFTRPLCSDLLARVALVHANGVESLAFVCSS